MSSVNSVSVRGVRIGGGAPVSIQSMTNADPHDRVALLTQIEQLAAASCEIVRLTVPDREAADVFAQVRKETEMPLVADIHFDYRMALAAIDAGADKIRINPGNIGSPARVREVVRAAEAARIPIRVGVNSGSLEKDILERDGRVTAAGLCESALRGVRQIEDMGYDKIVISLKSSDVRMNCEAYELIARETPHPLHIGVTEAGTYEQGRLRSAIGIGSLLLHDVGDTMRVSLTGDPVREVYAAREILETVGLREPAFRVISCPTCGRTEVDLESLAREVETRLKTLRVRPGLRVAVMGCVVNGPGEAREADYGVAGGRGKGVLFAGGTVVRTVEESEIVDALMCLIEEREQGRL